jgi:FSR family fosmidomycin resistance protein-like MFS transporter
MAIKSSDDMIIKRDVWTHAPDDRDTRALSLLCAGHFSVDMCQGVLPLLLPFLLRRMHLDYTATAFIVTTAYLTSSIAQPAFGMIRSRIVSRLALPVGVLLACGALAAAGQAHSYPLLLLCVVFSSLGVALYHPEAVSRANTASGTVNKGKGMSAFALCGSLGFSTGALIFGPILASVGLRGALYLLVPGIAVSLLLRLASMGEGIHAGPSEAGRMERRAAAAMAVLVGVVAVRQWAVAGTMTFLPLYFTQHLGQPPVVASRMMLALQIGSDAGTLCCGMIGQRFGYRTMLAAGMIAAAPFLLLFPHVTGWATAGLLFCSGFALALPVLATTMIGQEIMPHNRALAASLTLGFGVGLGGIASGMLGRIADIHGIGAALFLIGIVPLLGVALGMALRTQRA